MYIILIKIIKITQDLEGEDIFTKKIMPAIKTGIKNSIECVQDQVYIQF